MTTKEKFNKFLDERIEQANNDSSKTAYIIVQHQFNKLFKDNLMSPLDNEIISSATTDKEQAIKNTMCAGGNEICRKCSDICFYHGKHIDDIKNLKKTIPVPSIDINKLEEYMRTQLKEDFPFRVGIDNIIDNIIDNSIPHIISYLQNGVETNKEQPYNKQEIKELLKALNDSEYELDIADFNGLKDLLKRLMR